MPLRNGYKVAAATGQASLNNAEWPGLIDPDRQLDLILALLRQRSARPGQEKGKQTTSGHTSIQVLVTSLAIGGR